MTTEDSRYLVPSDGYRDRKGRQRRQNLITTDGKTYQPLT